LSRQPLSVECLGCGHRALVGLQAVRHRGDDMTPLASLRLRCQCGSREWRPTRLALIASACASYFFGEPTWVSWVAAGVGGGTSIIGLFILNRNEAKLVSIRSNMLQQLQRMVEVYRPQP
jgi:hypothetical protein